MNKSRYKSYALVAVQFACLIALAWTGPIIARTPVWLFVELAGVALGVWAIWSMRLFNFNVTPDVKVEGYMVDRGPYQMIRHPMYASLLLIFGALVADLFTWPRLVILLILAIDLVVKLRYEEGLLSAHYPQYAAYMARTKRLVPFVW